MSLERARYNMVMRQVRPWNVLDQRILDVMMTVHREDFFPAEYRNLALADVRLPVVPGVMSMVPREEGYLLQSLQPQKHENALLIGIANMYLAAVLTHLVDMVTLFVLDDEYDDACQRLGETTVEVIVVTSCNVAIQGKWSIIIGCASTGFLPQWAEALNDGGRLFVLEENGGLVQGKLICRKGSALVSERLFETDAALG